MFGLGNKEQKTETTTQQPAMEGIGSVPPAMPTQETTTISATSAMENKTEAPAAMQSSTTLAPETSSLATTIELPKTDSMGFSLDAKPAAGMQSMNGSSDYAMAPKTEGNEHMAGDMDPMSLGSNTEDKPVATPVSEMGMDMTAEKRPEGLMLTNEEAEKLVGILPILQKLQGQMPGESAGAVEPATDSEMPHAA